MNIPDIHTRDEAIRFLSSERFSSRLFSLLPVEWRTDPEIAELALRRRPICIRYIPPPFLLQHPHLVILATALNIDVFEYAPHELSFDLAFMTELIQAVRPEDIDILMQSFTPVIRDDRGINELIVRKCTNDPGERLFGALFMIPLPILRDDEFAEFALGHCSCFALLSAEQRSDRRFLDLAMNRDFTQFKDAASCLKFNPEVARWAIGQNGSCYLAVKDLQQDRSLLKLALQTYPEAYAKAPARFQADPEVAMPAVIRCGKMLAHAPYALQSDPKFLIVAVATAGHGWRVDGHIPFPYFRQNLDIYLQQLITFNLVCMKRGQLQCDDRRRRVEMPPISKLNEHGPHFALQFKKRIIQYWMGNFDQFITAAHMAPHPRTGAASVYWPRPEHLPFSL